MQGDSSRDFINFNEVAENTLQLLRLLLGERAYLIGHTSATDLRVVQAHGLSVSAFEDEVFLPIQDSY